MFLESCSFDHAPSIMLLQSCFFNHALSIMLLLSCSFNHFSSPNFPRTSSAPLSKSRRTCSFNHAPSIILLQSFLLPELSPNLVSTSLESSKISTQHTPSPPITLLPSFPEILLESSPYFFPEPRQHPSLGKSEAFRIPFLFTVLSFLLHFRNRPRKFPILFPEPRQHPLCSQPAPSQSSVATPRMHRAPHPRKPTLSPNPVSTLSVPSHVPPSPQSRPRACIAPPPQETATKKPRTKRRTDIGRLERGRYLIDGSTQHIRVSKCCSYTR